MAQNQHGGYRAPSRPAATSGPGRLSRRTDGGPSNPRVPPGGDYGDRQQLEQVQSAGAGAAAAQAGGPAGGGPGPAGAPPRPVNVFEPTRHPDQPITAGVPVGDGDDGMPDDGLDLLYALAQAFPHPHLTRLVEQR